MTSSEFLTKIKAEIERLKTFYRELHTDFVCESLLSFISTLESEKPIQEGLEEEIKKEIVKLPFFIKGKDQIAFARHFAQWGAEHLKK